VNVKFHLIGKQLAGFGYSLEKEVRLYLLLNRIDLDLDNIETTVATNITLNLEYILYLS